MSDIMFHKEIPLIVRYMRKAPGATVLETQNRKERSDMMKRTWKCFICMLALAVYAVFAACAEEGVIVINEDLSSLSQEETLEMLSEVTEEYFQDPDIAAELEQEIGMRQIVNPFDEDAGEIMSLGTVVYEGHTMRFLMDVIGEPGGNGKYPLYITLHGGGGGEPEGNDSQWFMMYEYYRNAVHSGIYVACRGITDTWDLHFRPESYPLYDRLIRAMIHMYDADPNRVYLLGFSAGGDGVYQIAARMADRFAAANMSSGHPNGVSLRNLLNCPFSIQVGVRDYYSESALRCVRGAEYEQVLTDYHELLGEGYDHQVLVHVPEGHNYDDYSSGHTSEVLADPAAFADPNIVEGMLCSFEEAFDTTVGPDYGDLSYYPAKENPAFDEAVQKIVKEDFNLETVFVNTSAVDYVSGFARDPAPKTVVWDLNTRAEKRTVSSFYWLKADASVTEGLITAFLNGDNTITVYPEDVNGDFSILVSPALLDVSRPIQIITPDGEYEVRVNPSQETMHASMLETGDPSLAWVAEIPYSSLSGVD